MTFVEKMDYFPLLLGPINEHWAIFCKFWSNIEFFQVKFRSFLVLNFRFFQRCALRATQTFWLKTRALRATCAFWARALRAHPLYYVLQFFLNSIKKIFDKKIYFFSINKNIYPNFRALNFLKKPNFRFGVYFIFWGFISYVRV